MRPGESEIRGCQGVRALNGSGEVANVKGLGQDGFRIFFRRREVAFYELNVRDWASTRGGISDAPTALTLTFFGFLGLRFAAPQA